MKNHENYLVFKTSRVFGNSFMTHLATPRKYRVFLLHWNSTILLKKPQLEQGDHLLALGLEPETSQTLEGPKESGFSNQYIGLNPSPRMFLQEQEYQI